VYFLLILLVLANLRKNNLRLTCPGFFLFHFLLITGNEIAVKLKIIMKYSAVYALVFELGLALYVSIDQWFISIPCFIGGAFMDKV
jgi:hypothetical protein